MPGRPSSAHRFRSHAFCAARFVSTSAGVNFGFSPSFNRRLACMSNSVAASASITTDTGFFLRSSLSHAHTRSPGWNWSSRPHHPPTFTSASGSSGHVFATVSPSMSSVTVRAFASVPFTVANGFGSSRRNSAVPATSLTVLFASSGVGGAGCRAAWIEPSGYSATQANHFT